MATFGIWFSSPSMIGRDLRGAAVCWRSGMRGRAWWSCLARGKGLSAPYGFGRTKPFPEDI
jgi:hypothetical protein